MACRRFHCVDTRIVRSSNTYCARMPPNGGRVVSTRPTPPAEPARRIRQDVVLIRSEKDRLAELVTAVAEKRLVPRVDRTLPLAEAGDAHRLVEAGGLHGKVVLVP